MAVIVSFVTIKGAGSVSSPAIHRCRARESLALNGVTTGATQENELLFIANNEASMVFVAWGTTPDAAAAAESAASSAGISVPAGQSFAVFPPEDSKVSAKAVS